MVHGEQVVDGQALEIKGIPYSLKRYFIITF